MGQFVNINTGKPELNPETAWKLWNQINDLGQKLWEVFGDDFRIFELEEERWEHSE